MCKISLQNEKNIFLKTNSKECISKTKDLWKVIKSLGLPKKSVGCIVGALAEHHIGKHDTKSILKTFNNSYSKLTRNLLAKVPKVPNRYIIKCVSDYYKKNSLSGKLDSTTKCYLFQLLKNIEVTKAAGIDETSEKFLKDRAQVLAKPISELCNLSITLGSFLNVCKIAKVKPLFKKG